MRIKEALAIQRIRRDADTAFFARAFAQEPPSKGDLVKGDVRPYGQLYILEIRRGAGGDKVIGR
jgi:hypothetical protein